MYKLLKINMNNKRLKTIVKVISILIYIITIPIIIFNMTLIIKSYINPNETPSFFGYKNYTIVSRSMENTINKNDVPRTRPNAAHRPVDYTNLHNSCLYRPVARLPQCLSAEQTMTNQGQYLPTTAFGLIFSILRRLYRWK